MAGDVTDLRLRSLESDQRQLWERASLVPEHSRRLDRAERRQDRFDQQRDEDRKEILAEVKDLRRTIVQASLVILGAVIAALVALAQVTPT